MSHTTANRRMGHAMLAVLLADLKTSGYLGMFSATRKRFTIKANGRIMTIQYVSVGNRNNLALTVSEVASERTEIVTNEFIAQAEGKFRIENAITSQWPLDALWVCNIVAQMLDLLYTHYNIDGSRKELHQGGNGYSSIAKESVVAEQERFRNAGSLAGAGSAE